MTQTPLSIDDLIARFTRLADEHRALIVAHGAMHHRLREAEAARLTALAEAAHELKKPLTRLALRIDRLPIDSEVATAMHADITRASRLIDDIITLNQLELRHVSPTETINIGTICRSIVTHYSLASNDRVWHTDIAEDITIDAPPEYVYAIIENLTQNAAKYTPTGGTITIRLVRDERGDIRLTVADTGIGIAPEMREHILRPFARAENGVKTAAGSGLGLAIVRTAIDAMNGTLTIASEVGRGSSFIVTLPRGHDEMTDEK